MARAAETKRAPATAMLFSGFSALCSQLVVDVKKVICLFINAGLHLAEFPCQIVFLITSIVNTLLVVTPSQGDYDSVCFKSYDWLYGLLACLVLQSPGKNRGFLLKDQLLRQKGG